jgi:hypothetical protein
MTGEFTFIMLFDEAATPMLEAVMASSMALRFPACSFVAERTKNPEFADIVIPVMNTKDSGDGWSSFVMGQPPVDLADDVRETFEDLLREANAAQPS